jgi:RING finger protein 113A
MSTTNQVKVPFFKKGKSRPATTRRRSGSPPAAAAHAHAPTPSSSKSEVVLPTRKAPTSLLSAGSKRTAAQRTEGDFDDDDAPRREGPDVKWTAAGSHAGTVMDIIAGDEIEELLAKRRKQDKEDRGEDEEEEAPDGLYKGQKAYRTHLKKDKEIPKAMRVGPQRGTSTIRTVTIVDYQPDVCKDYKGMRLLHFAVKNLADILDRNWLLRFRRYLQVLARPWHL